MPATSFSVKFALLLVFVSSFLVNGTFQAPIDCTDGSNPLFIKTKYSQMTVRAGEALFCPIMPGSDVQDCSTWMNYRMLQIAELSNPALNDFCFDDVYIPPAAAPYIHILKAIDRTNLTCQGEKFEDQILAPGVSGDVLTTIFSYPDMPGVFIQLNYSVPNASLDVNMGTSEFMEGRDLIYSYRYVSPIFRREKVGKDLMLIFASQCYLSQTQSNQAIHENFRLALGRKAYDRKIILGPPLRCSYGQRY